MNYKLVFHILGMILRVHQHTGLQPQILKGRVQKFGGPGGGELHRLDGPSQQPVESEKLPDSLVIQGDGTDSEVIEAEGLLDTDAFIALTNRDEENLLMAMTAQRHGVRR